MKLAVSNDFQFVTPFAITIYSVSTSSILVLFTRNEEYEGYLYLVKVPLFIIVALDLNDL